MKPAYPTRLLIKATQPHLVVLVWVALMIGPLGCTTTKYVSLRETPRNPLSGPLGLFSRSGPQATERTQQFLRTNDLESLAEADPRKMLFTLQELVANQPTPEGMYAISELTYIAGTEAVEQGNEALALDMFGAAVAHAYVYLLDPRFDQFRNPYDPEFRRACDLYNGSLEGALRIVSSRGELRPGFAHTVSTGDQQFEVKIVARGRWKTEEFDHFEFASDYQVTGLTNHYNSFGLGVPLIAVRKTGATESPNERFYPPGVTFPITAFMRVHTQSVLPPEECGHCKTVHACRLELYDPHVETETVAQHRRVPLESDSSVALAYFLSQPEFKQDIGWAGFINANKLRDAQGVYMLEPYDPDKIPVLLVHGLLSSPITWTETYNDLRNDRELGEKYQFWFYLYPTGQPFWVSAAQMRVDLADTLKTLDPNGKNHKLDQMVLIGHSMGGLLSKLQTIDSRDDFWHLVSEGNAQELEGSKEQLESLLMTLYFKPNPSIRRVITIGTPHRGSEHSNSVTRWATRQVAQLPNIIFESNHKLVRANPGLFDHTELFHINTGVDSLATDSPFLPAMLNAPSLPGTVYHNIVGDVVAEDTLLGRITGRGDGVVSLASSRVENAVTEDIVAAKHTEIHRHPKAILAVKRILREHWLKMGETSENRMVNFSETRQDGATPRKAYGLIDHFPDWPYDDRIPGESESARGESEGGGGLFENVARRLTGERR